MRKVNAKTCSEKFVFGFSGSMATLVTSPHLHDLSAKQGAGSSWGVPSLLVQSAAIFREMLSPCQCVHPTPGSIQELFSATLTPRFCCSEINLMLTTSLCSESKVFYLPCHSQMPSPTHPDNPILLSLPTELCCVGLGWEKEHQSPYCLWIAWKSMTHTTAMGSEQGVWFAWDGEEGKWWW